MGILKTSKGSDTWRKSGIGILWAVVWLQEQNFNNFVIEQDFNNFVNNTRSYHNELGVVVIKCRLYEIKINLLSK